MLRKTLVLTVAALAVLGVAMGTASASTVEVSPGSPDTLDITGGAEQNLMEVRQLAPGVIRIEDASVTGITPGSGCAPVDAQKAICAFPNPGRLEADLGAGDDDFFSYVANNGPADPFVGNYDIDGGDDNDALLGGQGTYDGGLGNDLIDTGGGGSLENPSTVDGGAGIDTIYTGAGKDTVDGGPDDDLIIDWWNLVNPAVSNDSYDGGSGIDTISYTHRVHKLKLDLGKGRGGEKREKDTYDEIEGLGGGENKDFILGDDENNYLSGSEESDKILGRDGNDKLYAGNGRRDVLDGGDGDDELDAVDNNNNDILKCRAGTDSYRLDIGDHPYKDCETLLP